MRIRVKDGDTNINIPIPTGLVFNRVSVWLWLRFARKMAKHNDKYLPDSVEASTDSFFLNVPDRKVYALCDELMRVKRRYGSWTLVEVQSADGEEVHITL